MTDPFELKKATWKDYRKFVHLCSVPTIPYHGGDCWILGDDVGFIGYSYSFRNNQLRNRIFPEILRLCKAEQCKYLNDNFRILSRIMVKPEYRGFGLAQAVLRRTLPLVDSYYIECLASEPIICHLLVSSGFKNCGWSKSREYYYYIRSRRLSEPAASSL